MSVTVKDRLRQSICFDESLQPEDVAEVYGLLQEKDYEIETIKQEMLDDASANDEREEALENKLNEAKAFLTQVRDQLDNTTCKRAKIAEECTKWLREHP